MTEPSLVPGRGLRGLRGLFQPAIENCHVTNTDAKRDISHGVAGITPFTPFTPFQELRILSICWVSTPDRYSHPTNNYLGN